MLGREVGHEERQLCDGVGGEQGAARQAPVQPAEDGPGDASSDQSPPGDDG